MFKTKFWICHYSMAEVSDSLQALSLSDIYIYIKYIHMILLWLTGHPTFSQSSAPPISSLAVFFARLSAPLRIR